MTKFLLPLLVLTAATPALATVNASQIAPISFERDGVAYVATVETRGAVQLISGREVQTGRPFQLVVRDGRVSGTYDDAPVNYAIVRK